MAEPHGGFIRYDDKLWACMSRGLAGICYYYTGSRTTGHAYDSRLSCYYGCLAPGVVVIDKRQTLSRCPSLACASLMLGMTLARDETNKFTDTDNWLLNFFSEQPDGYGPVARLAKAVPRAFDNVALDVLLAWWAERGVRIGVRKRTQSPGQTALSIRICTDGSYDMTLQRKCHNRGRFSNNARNRPQRPKSKAGRVLGVLRTDSNCGIVRHGNES